MNSLKCYSHISTLSRMIDEKNCENESYYNALIFDVHNRRSEK